MFQVKHDGAFDVSQSIFGINALGVTTRQTWTRDDKDSVLILFDGDVESRHVGTGDHVNHPISQNCPITRLSDHIDVVNLLLVDRYAAKKPTFS